MSAFNSSCLEIIYTPNEKFSLKISIPKWFLWVIAAAILGTTATAKIIEAIQKPSPKPLNVERLQ